MVTEKRVCKGCPELKTGLWQDYLENDWTETGISAWCTTKNGDKHISTYWHEEDESPAWCPKRSMD